MRNPFRRAPDAATIQLAWARADLEQAQRTIDALRACNARLRAELDAERASYQFYYQAYISKCRDKTA